VLTHNSFCCRPQPNLGDRGRSTGTRRPRQTGYEDDQIGADSETGDAANPSASMTYGEDDDSDESSSNTGDDDADS
jgi:hypothetical protein